MNWTEFIKFLASGYLLYYGVLVVLDLLKPQKGIFHRGNEDLLEFPEETQTTIIDEEAFQSEDSLKATERSEDQENQQWKLYGENVNVSTGGVSSMTELFRLAQDEMIEVKKNLVY
ncbi:hypothetical protein Q4534_06415 [Cyclobacterium sp. 1_MG-2023]|uniref:hypothetical protein n=1 Tax=Cyclobacterium sp. 1_MG-2023 TaxID=3062681 RepID=UPI0026E2C8BC|nr:hypothetical protein [Cyclobacterium sp. 1_MG-2023]MDO6437029.1 hypothetical protein [Cyclobacterium sp. 1_MG-2023]